MTWPFFKKNHQHVEDIDKVLTLVRQAGVALNLPKCHHFQKKIEYTSPILMSGRLATASNNGDAIKIAELPTENTQMRSFLGACNEYRIFIKDFFQMAQLLSAYLRKVKELDWHDFTTDNRGGAFYTLKCNLGEIF